MGLQGIFTGAQSKILGADSEVEQFLRNNGGILGYEDLQAAADVGVFEIFAKGQNVRGRNGKQ